MKSIRPIILLLPVFLLGPPPKASAQIAFDYPMEVGTVWLHQGRSPYVTDPCGFGCLFERWEVVEKTTTDELGVCALIEAEYEKPYRDPITFSLCIKDNRLTRNPASFGGLFWLNSSALSSEVLIDFNEATDTYWPSKVDIYSRIDTIYRKSKFEDDYLLVENYTLRQSDGYIPSHYALYEPEHHKYMDGVGYVGFTYWRGDGIYELRGAVIDGVVIGDTTFVRTTSTEGSGPMTDDGFMLHAAYPNPFNPKTVIGYQLSGFGQTRLAVYDLLGREVAVLVNDRQAPGEYQVSFDATGLASGIYVVRLEADERVATRRITLVK